MIITILHSKLLCVWTYAKAYFTHCDIEGHLSSLYRWSCMSAHVLLNLSNKLGKRDKMRDLPSSSSLFRIKFNNFNNIRARMLEYISLMASRLLWNLISGVKKCYNFDIMYAKLLWTSWRFSKICKPLVVYLFYCMALYHFQINLDITPGNDIHRYQCSIRWCVSAWRHLYWK